MHFAALWAGCRFLDSINNKNKGSIWTDAQVPVHWLVYQKIIWTWCMDQLPDLVVAERSLIKVTDGWQHNLCCLVTTERTEWMENFYGKKIDAQKKKVCCTQAHHHSCCDWWHQQESSRHMGGADHRHNNTAHGTRAYSVEHLCTLPLVSLLLKLV